MNCITFSITFTIIARFLFHLQFLWNGITKKESKENCGLLFGFAIHEGNKFKAQQSRIEKRTVLYFD